MLVAKSPEQAREKSPRPRFGHWEASTDRGEGGGAGAEAGLREPGHGGKRWAGAWPEQGVFLRMEEERAPFWTGAAKSEAITMAQRNPGGQAGWSLAVSPRAWHGPQGRPPRRLHVPG